MPVAAEQSRGLRIFWYRSLQQWQAEISEAVHAADIVPVYLSLQSIAETSYVQKAIGLALDTDDEEPEDSVFLIPAKLSECDTHQRLSACERVNLLKENGYKRLLHALPVSNSCPRTTGHTYAGRVLIAATTRLAALKWEKQLS